MLEQVAKFRSLLESLPLAADEFAVPCCRLSNAFGYLQSDEWGAARYELRLLAGLLRDPAEHRWRKGSNLASLAPRSLKVPP